MAGASSISLARITTRKTIYSPKLRSTILTITTSTADFISRYSTYSKLLFVTGWILRFIQNASIRDPNKRELLCHIYGKDTQEACRAPEPPVPRHLDTTQCNAATRLLGPQTLYSE